MSGMVVDQIPLGPATRERACRVLEQQLGAVWAAVLESHGLDPEQGWQVVLEGLALVPGPPAADAPADGQAAPTGLRSIPAVRLPLRGDG